MYGGGKCQILSYEDIYKVLLRQGQKASVLFIIWYSDFHKRMEYPVEPNNIQFIPCSPTNCLASCAQVRIVAVTCAPATMAIERMHVPYHMLEIYKKYNKFKYINMYLQPPTALSMAAEVGVASDPIAFTTPTLPILCALA